MPIPPRLRRPLQLLAITAALVLARAPGARAQPCPIVPDDAFAFIDTGNDQCPAEPEVHWPAASVDFDCDPFTAAETAIDCSGSSATCVDLCRNAASAWNQDLPGRFTFVEAAGDVKFCDTEDGRVSIGGTTKLCDGSNYGSRVLAVTLSIFFSSGPRTGELIDANITVNRAFRFSLAGFQSTLAHELGHVLGLSHPDDTACDRDANVLMRSSSFFGSLEACFVVDPTAADLNGAARIYPAIGSTPTPTPTAPVCGDADASGSVTVTDGVLVLRAAAELSSSCTPARCDADGNGAVTVTDGVHVLRDAAGLASIANCP